jgi:hypothetical protein
VRRFLAIAALALLALVIGTAARAQESLDQVDQGKAPAAPETASEPSESDRNLAIADGKATPEVNGYFDNRFSYGLVDPSSPVSTRDAPSFAELAEANIQLRVNLGSKLHFVYSDLSLVYQNGWLFYDDDGSGGRKAIAKHDVPALRPFVVPSELYLSVTVKPWLNVALGKKRITWSSGFAFNPMDLINPRKDPTDPNFQRAGNWLARVEAPFEKFTLSGLVAPQALYTEQGIPYAMLVYPRYPPADGTDTRDNSSHYLLAARLYLLFYDADVNLVYYFSNHYQDQLPNKSRVGISFSRYFFTDYEVHLEALLSRGSARGFPNHDCATGGATCNPCAAFESAKIDSGTFYPRIIVGTRRQFSDESSLSIEYYYQGDGYSGPEFKDAVRLLARAKAAVGLAPAVQSSSGGALPQRFSFDPLRRHYLIASYSKPKIFDDWTVSAVLIAGLRDLSGLISPSVSWSTKEWLTLGLYGYIPIRGLGVGEAKVGGRSWSEYSISPFDFRVLFEARAYY